MAGSDPHVEKIQRQFTRQAQAYSNMRQTKAESGLRALVTLAGVRGEERVIDVACGPGFLTVQFALQCRFAAGVDATPELLHAARREAARRGARNVAFVLADANRPVLRDGGFDVGACRAALHHFPDPAKVLGVLRRVVKPGGRILIADMLASGDPAKAAYHDRIERLCDPTHTRALPEAELDRLFHDAGLHVLQRVTSQIHYDVEAWLEHGGPGEESAREIRSLLEASLARDLCGLNVRREDGRLKFSHQTAAFVLCANPPTAQVAAPRAEGAR